MVTKPVCRAAARGNRDCAAACGTRWRAGISLTIAFATLFIAGRLQAATINVGNRFLLPNTANQKVTIVISGGEAVAGEDFFAQIGDGGTYNAGANTKPIFQNVDILTGTIFGSNNSGATGDPNGSPAGNNAGHPLIWVDGTTTSSGTVPATGSIATLTIDTTGVSSGTFPLLLSGVASHFGGFNTTFRTAGTGTPIPLTITNGTITVPEPAALSFVGFSGLLAMRRRSH